MKGVLFRRDYSDSVVLYVTSGVPIQHELPHQIDGKPVSLAYVPAGSRII